MNWSISECKNPQTARLTIWWLFIKCDNPGQAELLEIEKLSWAHRKGKSAPVNSAASVTQSQNARKTWKSMSEDWVGVKR